MNDNYNEEKTENPTSYRLKKAKKEGNNRFSRELNSLLILITSLMIFWFNKTKIANIFERIMRSSFIFDTFIVQEEYIFDSNSFILLSSNILDLLKIVFVPMFLTILCSIMFSNFNFYIKPLKFNFSKLNPFKGFKRLFSSQIFIELFKTILKILLISYIAHFYMFKLFFQSLNFLDKNVCFSLKNSFFIIFLCILTILIAIVPIVFFDIFWEKYSYYKQLRMTRKEIRDEFKKTEGNPYVKSRIRRTMRMITRRRMMSKVPKSDVIVVNPSHYAVAVKYNEDSMSAPKILAKGSGELALRIRKIGEKHSIPILFSSVLARTLYHYTDIGKYIPSALYAAVAEVLAWVWKIRTWKKEGGIFPEQPHNFFIPLELRTIEEDKNS
ncbi:MAG: flagellar biosynthesis protein FlhB [Buchnera aphidicola (Schlechtendalia peitan)]